MSSRVDMPASPKRIVGADERKDILRAALIGATLAGVLVGGLAIAGRATLSDGLISRYIAAHLNINPADVHPVVSSRGTSLRYGRILLSWLIWILSGGRAGAMAFVQGAIMVACAGAACAAARALLPGRPAIAGLLPLAAFGFTLSIAAGFQDALAVALGLWAVVAATRERWWIAASLLGAALLARENAGAVFVGLCVLPIVKRQPKPVFILAVSVAPVALWSVHVASRYGHIPLFDPYLRVTTTTVRPPVLAVWESLTRSPAQAAAVAAIHLGLAVWAFRLWRSSTLGAVAAAAGLQVLWAGPFAWNFTGEAVRAFAPLQVFLILAIARQRLGTTDDQLSGLRMPP